MDSCTESGFIRMTTVWLVIYHRLAFIYLCLSDDTYPTLHLAVKEGRSYQSKHFDRRYTIEEWPRTSHRFSLSGERIWRLSSMSVNWSQNMFMFWYVITRFASFKYASNLYLLQSYTVQYIYPNQSRGNKIVYVVSWYLVNVNSQTDVPWLTKLGIKFSCLRLKDYKNSTINICVTQKKILYYWVTDSSPTRGRNQLQLADLIETAQSDVYDFVWTFIVLKMKGRTALHT